MSKTLQDLIVDLAEGNPGALSVLIDIVKRGRADLLLVLRDHEIRGSQIWTTFKDENGEDLESMMMHLELMA